MQTALCPQPVQLLACNKSYAAGEDKRQKVAPFVEPRLPKVTFTRRTLVDGKRAVLP